MGIWSSIPIEARYFLVSWLLFSFVAFFLFVKKSNWFLPSFAFSVFCLASAFALFTPYLYRWDEQFHALVGKNLSIDPFHPKLISLDPTLWSSEGWANTSTWLHKQPLFLYQIALSIKVLGASIYAVRFPSVLLHVVGTLVVFDLGKMMIHRNFAFAAAFLFSLSSFPLGLVSGRIGTDHNDLVFMIYVLLSFWTWFKFYTSDDKKWVKWIGIFVGCAILTKWLVGLLVFAPWALWLLFGLTQKRKVDFASFFKAFGIAFLVVAPWQIYTFSLFPKEAKYEMEYNSRHFFEAVEGHAGDWKYHFTNIDPIFFNAWFFLFILIASVAIILKSKRKTKFMGIALLFSSCLIYVFFTLAETKMVAFVAPAFPFLILLLTLPFYSVLAKIPKFWWRSLSAIILLFLGFFLLFKPILVAKEYYFKRTDVHNPGKIMQEQWSFFEKNPINQPKQIVVNAGMRDYGSVTWQFVNGTIALTGFPSEIELKRFRKAGYSIWCVNWQEGEPIPAYIRLDSTIQYIQFE